MTSTFTFLGGEVEHLGIDSCMLVVEIQENTEVCLYLGVSDPLICSGLHPTAGDKAPEPRVVFLVL